LQFKEQELARVHFGPGLRRPFVFPIVGPSGRPLTRLGHPHDPVGHSHHNSVWLAHNDVNGIDFWADRGPNTGRIIYQGVEKLEDGLDQGAVTFLNHWMGPDGKVLLVEYRRLALQPLPFPSPAEQKEWLLLIDVCLLARDGKVTLGKTPFGLAAVRMAKTIGVADGGGTIRNSAGMVNEKGERGCFWKPARWVDYSGPVARGMIVEGITLFDHPANPNHPSVFHVREDGWMGSSLTFAEPRLLEPGKPLRLRYGLYVHQGMPPAKTIQDRWEEFTRLNRQDIGPVQK
jgi:hypothetical protein